MSRRTNDPAREMGSHRRCTRGPQPDHRARVLEDSPQGLPHRDEAREGALGGVMGRFLSLADASLMPHPVDSNRGGEMSQCCCGAAATTIKRWSESDRQDVMHDDVYDE